MQFQKLVSILTGIAVAQSVFAETFTQPATINDPDGYTWVRAAASTSANRIGKVVEGETFWTYPQQSSWWRVRTRDGTTGYIHSSRIRLGQSARSQTAGVPVAGQTRGAWCEYRRSLWDSGQSKEMTVWVWDDSPNLRRSVSWSGGVDSEGRAQGSGTVEWRSAGAAAYGSEGLLAVYEGSMKAGQRNGQGTFRLASGERYQGQWRDDRPEGQGELWFANGDYYKGSFSAGQPHGRGIYLRAGVESFDGQFARGLRSGEGTVTFPGGQSYHANWESGRESPESLARRSALLSAADTSNQLRLGLVTGLNRNERYQRETYGLGAIYQLEYRNGEFFVEPKSKKLDNYRAGGTLESEFDIPSAGALCLDLAVENDRGREIVIERGVLQVESSRTDPEPLVCLEHDYDAKHSETAFQLVNAGWGPARNCVLELNLLRSDLRPQEGYEFRLELGDFTGQTKKISLRDSLGRCGVDLAFIESNDSNALRRLVGKWTRAQADPVFGRFAKYGPNGTLESAFVAISGKLSYDWSDVDGKGQRHSVLYKEGIQLIQLAEGGGDLAKNAIFHIQLRPDDRGYQIPFSYREKIPVSRSSRLALDLSVPRSSFHRFRVALHGTDGTVLRSAPCNLRFYFPRRLSNTEP